MNFPRQTVTSVHSSGWKGFELGKWMEQTLGIPCRLDNDANAGALGEYHYGAGRGAKMMVYVTISTGIGSGIIYEGKLLRGKDFMAGEIGHIVVSDSGARCSCGGRGCLESFSSGGAIETRAREWAERRPDRVARMVELSGGPEITAKGLMEAAAEGDAPASHILRETTRWLARGLLMVIRILNPDVIVLGGGVSQSGVHAPQHLAGFSRRICLANHQLLHGNRYGSPGKLLRPLWGRSHGTGHALGDSERGRSHHGQAQNHAGEGVVFLRAIPVQGHHQHDADQRDHQQVGMGKAHRAAEVCLMPGFQHEP